MKAIKLPRSRRPLLMALLATQTRSMVSFHGHSSFALPPRSRGMMQATKNVEKPPDPNRISETELEFHITKLLDWWNGKQNVLCLTGAGLSTESGIPDYRGHNGSYHYGHKPMVHDQFMSSHQQRQRYWGRGMIGWRSFDTRQPNAGHYALAALERIGRLGVSKEDVALITQNVDTLHRKAGSKQVIELHGRTNELVCMKCGGTRDRRSFHDEIDALNHEWLSQQTISVDLRPDGDAAVEADYGSIQIPPCQHCGNGIMKPNVVFFGDSVPASRVARCQAAVEAADGLLVVGSSLAVHSAFRHVRAASQRGLPIAILNVGETRAEVEGLDVLKIEAPAGRTLSSVAEYFGEHGELSVELD